MKNKFYIITLTTILVFLLTGCESLIPSSRVGSRYFTLVPGDCCGIGYSYEVMTNGDDGNRIQILLRTELKDPVLKTSKESRTCHRFPSDDIFKNYEESVKQTFYNLSFDIEKNMSWCPKYAYYSTVFPIGSTTVTANKDFQGIRAGEDISSLLIKKEPEFCSEPWDHPLRINSIKDFIDDLDIYHNLGLFYIVLSAPQTMEEDTKFTVSVPVRKVKILQWLDDLSESQDAPMPYTDETITWSVVVQAFKIDSKGNVHFLRTE